MDSERQGHYCWRVAATEALCSASLSGSLAPWPVMKTLTRRDAAADLEAVTALCSDDDHRLHCSPAPSSGLL
jgi:hypothetical protein